MKGSFVVSAAQARKTLAAVLRQADASLSWEQARKLCERGKVFVGDEVEVDGARRMRAGEVVRVDERASRPAAIVARARIVHDDSAVVIIDKPAGVSSVPYDEREMGTAMDLVRDAWRAMGRRATQTPLHIVHRIDKDTSGLLAFAKTKHAERALQERFRAHDIERTYLCVVHGVLAEPRRIESRIVPDRGDGLRGSTRRPEQGKRAVTHVRPVEALAGATLCEVKLETGKTHQIRIHLSELGHPLVGERVYIRDFLKQGRDVIDCPRLLLHAATLGFVHPVTGKALSWSAPLPDDFERALAKLRR
jgi:23S rRNA pseudouridine1911/1915/1917 synthase